MKLAIEYTPQEQKVLDLLLATWTAFCQLPQEHSDGLNEFRHGMHDLQRQVMTRPITRALNENSG